MHGSSIELLVSIFRTLEVFWYVRKPSEDLSMQETSQSNRQGGNLLNLGLVPAAEQSKASVYKASQGLESDVAARQPESPMYRSGVDVDFLRNHDI